MTIVERDSRLLSSSTRHATNLSWLIRLRWGAFASQGALVLAVDRFSAIQLPVPRLFLLLGFGLATNLALTIWARARSKHAAEHLLAGVLALDLLILTGLLYLTGGPFNPFTSLYLVHIALAPVVLGARWTWALVALSVGCFAILFADHVWLKVDTLDHMTQMRIHLKGMWIAFTVAAAFIGYFVHKVQRALSRQEEELARSKSREARSEKLAALATLAAGAAHELSTPLSTIALAAKEVERQLRQKGDEGSLFTDAVLIRDQVERCRSILERMAADAGTSVGDGLADVQLLSFLEACIEDLPATPEVRLVVEPSVRTLSVSVPLRSLSMAMRGILKNAQEASGPDQIICFHAGLHDDDLVLEVRDEGAGMKSEVLARTGEPFFTTKDPGKGMGLGLFLATAVADHLGGDLRTESKEGAGTTVRVTLPHRAVTHERESSSSTHASTSAFRPVTSR